MLEALEEASKSSLLAPWRLALSQNCTSHSCLRLGRHGFAVKSRSAVSWLATGR